MWRFRVPERSFWRVSSDVIRSADQWQWAEGLPGVRHEGLDLIHTAQQARQELHTVLRHSDVILDAHLGRFPKASLAYVAR